VAQRSLGQGVEVERPHQLVDVQRVVSEELREPPLRRPAHQRHLPEPVLGVDEAEPEEGVGILAGEDVRHRMGVADDLEGGSRPLHGEAAVVVGNRLTREIVGEAQRHSREYREENEDPGEPGDDPGHEDHLPPRALTAFR
jgi:hypothetical protein